MAKSARAKSKDSQNKSHIRKAGGASGGGPSFHPRIEKIGEAKPPR